MRMVSSNDEPVCSRISSKMKRLSLLAIDCKFICRIKVRYFKALEAIVRYSVLWLENAEIILLTKKLDQGKK